MRAFGVLTHNEAGLRLVHAREEVLYVTLPSQLDLRECPTVCRRPLLSGTLRTWVDKLVHTMRMANSLDSDWHNDKDTLSQDD